MGGAVCNALNGGSCRSCNRRCSSHRDHGACAADNSGMARLGLLGRCDFNVPLRVHSCRRQHNDATASCAMGNTRLRVAVPPGARARRGCFPQHQASRRSTQADNPVATSARPSAREKKAYFDTIAKCPEQWCEAASCQPPGGPPSHPLLANVAGARPPEPVGSSCQRGGTWEDGTIDAADLPGARIEVGVAPFLCLRKG